MKIDIQAKDFELSDVLREHVSRRLTFALSTREQHIERIEVRLYDLNGPKGGEDICCHIRILIPGIKEVVIRDVESELMTAIDRACDRAGRTVSRQLDRKLKKTRSFNPQAISHSIYQ